MHIDKVACPSCNEEVYKSYLNKIERKHCSQTCKAKSEGRHGCKKPVASTTFLWGPAISECYEKEDGKFGVENGEASANTLEIDYIGAWMER